MPRISRGNYTFITYVGDHGPYHVHVYKDRKLVVKWDLENSQAMEGKANSRVRKHIAQLKKEGRI